MKKNIKPVLKSTLWSDTTFAAFTLCMIMSVVLSIYLHDDIIIKDIIRYLLISLPVFLILIFIYNYIKMKFDIVASFFFKNIAGIKPSPEAQQEPQFENTPKDILNKVPKGDLRLIWLDTKNKRKALDELNYSNIIALLEACVENAEDLDRLVIGTKGEKKEKYKKTLILQIKDILDIQNYISLINEETLMEKIGGPANTIQVLDHIEYGEHVFVYTCESKDNNKNGGILKKDYKIELVSTSSITLKELPIKWMSLKEHAKWEKENITKL